MKLKTTPTLAASLMETTAMAKDKQIAVASWAGSCQEAQSKALFAPAEAKWGIKIKQVSYGIMFDVRFQVQTGQMIPDVVSSGSGSATRATAEGLPEEIKYSVVHASSFIPSTRVSVVTCSRPFTPGTPIPMTKTTRRAGLISGMSRNFRANAPIAAKLPMRLSLP